ncbi:glycosyltransferase family 1 protein [Streptomyces roseirectus]|uniref:Glycosyltransferase family 1 protein n=1 Tax=Streptomyces roseirectus TaxID=2768066 RepID=A0A7H0INF9_9ACTN|nr:glycosyltransferase [Streptomyces roseirectus]QNP74325.1 glycosyltransferase family 1 protein [Streptomyces roseirectus]
MRVLLMSFGSRGDVEPMAALAASLRTRGAEVRVCVPPDEEFARLLEAVGAEVVPFGMSVRALVSGPKPVDPFQTAKALVAEHFETVGAAAEGCDVVLASGLLPAGIRSVAELRGIPYVFALFQPTSIPSPDYPPLPRPGKPFPPDEKDNMVLWGLDGEKVNALYGEALNTHRAARGLPPVDSVRDHVFTDRPWLAADTTLAPTDRQVVHTGAWILPDTRPLAADLEAFLAAGEPPVYVGFGSMALRGASAEVAQAAVAAVRAQGRRVLLARGWAELMPVDDLADCHTVGEVNHQALFRRVAAVVHHGGAGTTTTAALAGAPQVVVPQIVDQPYWASRVADLGIGAAHDGPVPTFESLTAALETALAPETAVRAKAVAAQVRADGADVAAKLLIEQAG